MIEPNVRDTLFLYLGVSYSVVSIVMVKEVEDDHRPIYYVRKVLQKAETRYSTIEKFAYMVVIATRKTKAYF